MFWGDVASINFEEKDIIYIYIYICIYIYYIYLYLYVYVNFTLTNHIQTKKAAIY